jgi:hypothetical protein
MAQERSGGDGSDHAVLIADTGYGANTSGLCRCSVSCQGRVADRQGFLDAAVSNPMRIAQLAAIYLAATVLFLVLRG